MTNALLTKNRVTRWKREMIALLMQQTSRVLSDELHAETEKLSNEEGESHLLLTALPAEGSEASVYAAILVSTGQVEVTFRDHQGALTDTVGVDHID